MKLILKSWPAGVKNHAPWRRGFTPRHKAVEAFGIGLGFRTSTPATAGRHVAAILTPDADQEGCQGIPIQNSQAVDGWIDKKGFVNLSRFGIELAKAPLMSILHRFIRPGRED